MNTIAAVETAAGGKPKPMKKQRSSSVESDQKDTFREGERPWQKWHMLARIPKSYLVLQALQYFHYGLRVLVLLCINNILKRDFLLPNSEIQFWDLILLLPTFLKPLYGLFIDYVGPFRQRKKFLIILGGSI